MTLRPLRAVADIGAARWCRWLAAPLVRRYLESRGRWTPARLHDWLVGHRATLGTRLYAICLEGKPVGTLKLEGVARGSWANLALMIGEKRAWGRGIGTAAIRRGCGVAKRRGCVGVWAGMRAANQASRIAFTRAGFIEVARDGFSAQETFGARQDVLDMDTPKVIRKTVFAWPRRPARLALCRAL